MQRRSASSKLVFNLLQQKKNNKNKKTTTTSTASGCRTHYVKLLHLGRAMSSVYGPFLLFQRKTIQLHFAINVPLGVELKSFYITNLFRAVES